MAQMAANWDPATLANQEVTPHCSIRLRRDLMAIYTDPPPGIFVVPDEADMTLVHALITGSFDTPYEGGMFYFIVRFPPDYPIQPPKVKLMTTDAGKVRFNPNLYRCGKVCLSILGTWTGPAWSPAHTLSSVLISIQSLMNEKPYHNEPGFERERIPGDCERYNDVIRHETLRVAVLGMVENDTDLTIPAPLRDVMEKTFLQFYDSYITLAINKQHVHGQRLIDPFGGENSGRFLYRDLLERLRTVHARLSHKWPNTTPSTPTSEGEPSKPAQQ